MPKRDAVERFLPLKPAAFHILLALADGARHGYAIRTAVEELTRGGIRLWPATLYGSIGELEDAGLIEEWTPADAPDALPRRFYKLTRLGLRVLVGETERLEGLVRLARASVGRRRLTARAPSS